ncbi:MAG: NADH-quinone oxidoreductase subunit J [Verrucomicrobia bacterium]|nr:NADH-quinone oxidoreductase subunit J [Verrucomicrobiota bacterium]
MLLAAFWFFATLMLLFSLSVVLLRNPVSCAMSLVMSFICLAALYVTLDATFIGVIQVLVYAGAVMVLFLFIIMLLDLREEKSRRLNFGVTLGGVLVVAAFLSIMTQVILSNPAFAIPTPTIAGPQLSDVKMIGMTLFHSFRLPFEVIGVLLLSATVGVVVLSRRTLR